MWISACLFVLASASALLAQPPSRPGPPRTAESEFERVLRRQVLLDRAHFSPGELDGRAGSSLASASRAYARERMGGLNVDEAAVADTLASNDPAPVLTMYTITQADVKGPFEPIPPDMMKQAELKALGYSSAIEGIAEKFHASPALLKRLNPRAKWAAGEEINVPNVSRSAISGAAKVIVNQADQSVMALDSAGAVMARYPATLGSERDPLPVGEWKINGVSRNPPFNYNPDLFWDAKPQHSKAVLPPGPNNPVGVVWIDLSKENMGIHGTPEPSIIGKRQSHGCIRLTNWDASELADLVKPGTPASLVER